jgi:hypothetical protein
MLNEQRRTRPEHRRKERPIHCDECTIQIGAGYEESHPFRFVDDSSERSQTLIVCSRCWESLNRRRQKRLAQTVPQEPGTIH